MYKCEECKFVFERPDVWKESRGEFWGMPAFEEVTGCPNCNSGDFEEYKGENDDDG